MKIDTDTQISELKRKLLLKTAELDSAVVSIADLTRRLKESTSHLQNLEVELATSDATGVVLDAELKKHSKTL